LECVSLLPPFAKPINTGIKNEGASKLAHSKAPFRRAFCKNYAALGEAAALQDFSSLFDKIGGITMIFASPVDEQ